jgi:hypothetical protein
VSPCYCSRPDRNCEKCRAQAETYKVSDMPPVPTTVHVTMPSVCCQTCERWERLPFRVVGVCGCLTDLDIRGVIINETGVFTKPTFGCVEWAAR